MRTVSIVCQNPLAIVAALTILVIVVVSFFAPWLTPYDPYETDLALSLARPSASHWFGTDEYGRDILTRILYGARVSLRGSVVAVALSCSLGTMLGATAGYLGGSFDQIAMGLLDVLMAVPPLVLALAAMALLGKGIENAILAVSLALIPEYARMVRSAVLAAKRSGYVEAARALGNTPGRIITRHLFPHLAPLVVSRATAGLSMAILDMAALGFLGLGVSAPTAEWGAMLAGARSYLFFAPHLLLFPGLMITVTGLSFNLLGDALTTALNPVRNRKHV